MANEQLIPNWHDVELLALHDPVLHAAVTRVRQGTLSQEEALIWAVMTFSEQVTALKRAKTDALYFGNGFVLVVHDDGEFRCRTLNPATVVIHDKK